MYRIMLRHKFGFTRLVIRSRQLKLNGHIFQVSIESGLRQFTKYVKILNKSQHTRLHLCFKQLPPHSRRFRTSNNGITELLFRLCDVAGVNLTHGSLYTRRRFIPVIWKTNFHLKLVIQNLRSKKGLIGLATRCDVIGEIYSENWTKLTVTPSPARGSC